jgi:hypothetical protein
MASQKKNVHVVPQQSGNPWAVKPVGAKVPTSTHRTQQAAQDAARRIAKQTKGEVVIHRPNGQIRDKDSYGADPNPPKDTKH